MWYKAYHKVGIRRCFDAHNQLCQFGLPSRSKKELMKIGEAAIKRMTCGEQEEQVRAWIKTQMQ